MRRNFSYYFLILMILFFAGMNSLQAQNYQLNRWVIGSGGSVGVINPNNQQLSGMVGQLAIENIIGTVNGEQKTVEQGFWIGNVGHGTSVDEPTIDLAQNLNNYPNPFSTSTMIRYELTGTSHVTLKVYDLVGNTVRVLVNGSVQSGLTEIPWDGRDDRGLDLGTGSYVYELTITPVQTPGESYKLRNMMVIVK